MPHPAGHQEALLFCSLFCSVIKTSSGIGGLLVCWLHKKSGAASFQTSCQFESHLGIQQGIENLDMFLLSRFMSVKKSWANLKSWKIMSAVLKEPSGPGDWYLWGLWSGQGLYLLSLMSFSRLLGQHRTSREFSGNLSSLPTPAKN